MSVAVVSAVIAVVAALAASAQVFFLRESTHAGLLRDALRDIYSKELRDDRAKLYHLSTKAYSEWSRDDFETANRVAIFFARIGFLVYRKYLPRRDFVEFWGEITIRCYKVCEPMIVARRDSESIPHHFIHFEWLAREAIKGSNRQPWWLSRSWRRTVRRTDPQLRATVEIPGVPRDG